MHLFNQRKVTENKRFDLFLLSNFSPHIFIILHLTLGQRNTAVYSADPVFRIFC